MDRDGVINEDSKDYIKSVDEWIPIESSLAAIALLSQQFTIAVATNQSGIGRQYYTHAILANIHKKMLAAVHTHGGEIRHIEYCPHLASDQCDCRKPQPQMLKNIYQALQVDASQCVFIGDKISDIQAAIHAQCTPILVKTGYGEETLQKHSVFLRENAIQIFANLFEFAKKIPDSIKL